MGTTGSNLPVSFEGTILSGSYQPLFISLDGQHKEKTIVTGAGTIIEPRWNLIDTTRIVSSCYSYQAFIADGSSFSLWNMLKNLWEWITKKEQIKDLKNQIWAIHNKATEEFTFYVTKHEELLYKSQLHTDRINRKKTMMKDYLLKKLHERLIHMGIDAKWTDMHDEHLDLRNFPINEQFNMNKEKKGLFFNGLLSSIDIVDFFLYEYFGNLLLIPVKSVLARKKVSELEENLSKIKCIQEDNSERMDADLHQLSNFCLALDNVANIFTDILDCLMPIMEKLLTEMSERYGNNLKLMSQEKVTALQRIKDILKEMAESVIIPKREQKQTINATIRYSNNLSARHYDLKVEIQKMAV